MSEEESFNNLPPAVIRTAPIQSRPTVVSAVATPSASSSSKVKTEVNEDTRAPEKMKFVPKLPIRLKRLASPAATVEDIKPDLDRLYGVDPTAPKIAEADRTEGVLGFS